MIIRKALLADLAQLASLFDQYRQFYRQPSNHSDAEVFLRERLAKNDSVILLACLETEVVGFVQLYPSFSSVSMQPIYILNDLYVSSSARRRGIATALMQETINYAAELGAIRVTLATEKNNTSAQSLYEKLNWLQDEKFIHYNFSVDV